MAKKRKQRSGSETEDQDPSPKMLIAKMLPKDLVRNGILNFLDRDSILSFMSVKQFSKEFRPFRCFCKGHGTKLGPVWGGWAENGLPRLRDGSDCPVSLREM
jgi:hypothetical protein